VADGSALPSPRSPTTVRRLIIFRAAEIRVEELSISGTLITDVGLAHLVNLTKLKKLYLGRTRLGDAGLVHLQRMTRLGILSLDQTQVGDTGLIYLRELKSLWSLNLKNTMVTDAGIRELRKALRRTLIDYQSVQPGLHRSSR